MAEKDLKNDIEQVSRRLSAMRDDLVTFQSEFNAFKDNVVKDLKNIVTYMGNKTVK